MADFFVNPDEEETVDFGDGWKVIIHSEMTAGMQEDYENQILLLEMRDVDLEEDSSNGVSSSQPGAVGIKKALDPAEIKARVQMGNLYLLKLNIIRIIPPEGESFTPTVEQIRSMSRARYAIILQEVNRRNPPLSVLRELTFKPTTGS